MPYRNESEFNREWSGWLERAGAKVLPLVGNTYTPAGWPDRFVAHKTFGGWVEGKKDAGRLKDIQRVVMQDLCIRHVPALELKYLSDTDVIVVKCPWGEVHAQHAHDRVAGAERPGLVLLEMLAAAWEKTRERP